MQSYYSLEWLDKTTISLLGALDKATDINPIEAERTIHNIRSEENNIQYILMNQVFGLQKEEKIELLIRKYHSSLIILMDQVLEHNIYSNDQVTNLKTVIAELTTCLSDLLSFIENRFSLFLSPDERVPATYLAITKKEFAARKKKLKNLNANITGDQEALDIVLNSFSSFENLPKEYPVTFKDILYKKELLKALESLTISTNDEHIYPDIIEMLIYLNFNSKAFVKHFTVWIATKINKEDVPTAKLERLHFYFKSFNQVHIKPGCIFNSRDADLKTTLTNWFKQEILFLQKQANFSSLNDTVREKSGKTNKILCALSTDQMGLILRAAGELKIVISKSMNEIFRTIVPHLSTPQKKELSFDAMRSKAYAAESRDKEKAIEMLDQLIRKIKEY